MARKKGMARTQLTMDNRVTTVRTGSIKSVKKPKPAKVIGTTLSKSQFGRSGGTQMHSMFAPSYSRDSIGRLRRNGKMVKQSVPKVAIGTAQVKLEV